MLGAIIGDIVGSTYEHKNIKTKDFSFFTYKDFFTDDTILTLAVGYGLKVRKDTAGQISRCVVSSLRDLCNKYPDVGYGNSFYRWFTTPGAKAYGSYGNGAASRISPVVDFSSSPEELVKMTRIVTAITHNHVQAVKAANAVVSAISMAREKKSIEEIKEHICKNYYKIDFTLEEIRPNYKFDYSCQGSVPQALECFFESTSFEDALRNAVSIGGDSDTIAAITGSIAQEYYGIPFDIGARALSYLDDYLFLTYKKIGIKELTFNIKLIGGIKKEDSWSIDDVYYFQIGNLIYPYMVGKLSKSYPIPNFGDLLSIEGFECISDPKIIPDKVIENTEKYVNKHFFTYLDAERQRYK